MGIDKLFIAEKPSMGRELAANLNGPRQYHKDYIHCGEDVVIWAYGHILRQKMPDKYDEKYRFWQAENLPIVPHQWELLVDERASAQFGRIAEFVEAARMIVHAGDPDREGQLLIDEILMYLGNTKPVYRILLNALDEKSIRKALVDLRNNESFEPLRDSALARSRADWLMGMNLSRAYTLRARREGHGRVVFPIGRVKTPTLALVVRREREINDFIPKEYFLLKVNFRTANGILPTKWKPREEQIGLDSEGRLIQKYIGEEILRSLEKEPEGRISAHSKQKKSEPAPLPLSLSALQVLAGKMYGYEPQLVLDTAQELYERKLTSYPRSDCDYLPKNQLEDVVAILGHLGAGENQWTAAAQGADSELVSRAWDDGKITAHHAIIPTTVPCPAEKLTATQRNIYYLIARAYIAQFYPLYRYEQTKLTVTAAEEEFTASGRVEIEAGWKALYRKDAKDEDKDGEEEEKGGLPLVSKGEKVIYVDGLLDPKTTKPPQRFTPSTLLEAMKGIHRYVHDESLKKQLRAVAGIGTEATRATIIAELTKRKLLREEGRKKYLYPTEMAYILIDSLPEALTYPDETAKWEERLAEMSEGKDSLESFLADQTEYVTALVAMANDDLNGMGTSDSRVSTAPMCAACGKQMVRRSGKYGAFYGCSGYPNCRHTETIIDNDEMPPDKAREHICPRCGEGKFVKVGNEWRCGNYPACRTISADCDGVPAVIAFRRRNR